MPADLLAHDCRVYTSGARVFDEWSFLHEGVTTADRVPGKIHINDGMALVAASADRPGSGPIHDVTSGCGATRALRPLGARRQIGVQIRDMGVHAGFALPRGHGQGVLPAL